MKNDSLELQETLYEILDDNIDEIIYKTGALEPFSEYLQGKKFTNIYIDSILNKEKSYSDLSEGVILSLIEAINYTLVEKASDRPIIDPLDYFTPQEVAQAVSYRYEKPKIFEQKEFPMELSGVIEGNENSFTLNMTARELGELKLSNLTYWNSEVQREGEKTRVDNSIIITPKFYTKNRREIKKNILAGSQNESLIVLNVPLGITNTTEHEERLFDSVDLNFNKNTNKLQIDIGARFDIVDGAHRVQACADAIEEDSENENLDRTHFVVKILNIDDDEAKSFQAQLAKATPLKKSRVIELAQETLAAQVVQRMKSDPKSDLYNRISSNDKSLKKSGDYTTFIVMTTSIESSFGDMLNKRFDVIKVANILNEYYMMAFGLFEEYLLNKNNLLFQDKTFALHNEIARRMYDNGIDFSEIDKYIDPTNFDIDNLQRENPNFLRIFSRRTHNKVSSKKSLKLFMENFKIKEISRKEVVK